MELNVAKIVEKKGACLSFNFTEEFAPIVFGGEKIDFAKPLLVEGVATNVGSGILVEGRVNTQVIINCSRCLRPVSIDIDTGFTEEYVKEDTLSFQERKDAYEKGEIHTYKDNTLEIVDEIMENVLLCIPMKVLCSINCKGICHHCGNDLNIADCNCKDENIDPRFSKLKKWLKE